MSFRCGSCKVAQPSGTQPVRKTLAVRRVVYVRVEKPRDERDTRPMEERRGLGYSEGTETVRVADLCESCANSAKQTITEGNDKIVHFC